MHMMIFNPVTADRLKCTYTHVESQVRSTDSFSPDPFQEILCKMKACGRSSDRSLITAVYCLIHLPVQHSIRPVDVWRQRDMPCFLETVMKNVTLPPLIQDILRQNLLTSAFSGSANTVNEYVTSTIVTVLLQAGSFMLCYFACFLALHVVINLVDHVFYFPVLRHFDWAMAAVMGLLRGIAVIWVLLLAVPVIRIVIPFDLLEQYLSQSKLLPLIDSDAFFLRVVSGL